jgi:hypothetical protein
MTSGAPRTDRLLSHGRDSGLTGRRALRWGSGCGCVVVLLGSLGHAAAPSQWTVEVLMGLLKAQREHSVPFQEATYSSLLTKPLIAHGVLKFVPPDRLEKLITAPSHEQYVVEGNRVTFESERKGVKRTISLEEYPALRSFVEAFRSSLNGDVVQLYQVYEVTLEGSREEWTLLLRPREPSGKSVVDYILFTGSEGRVATIAIRAPDGDRSVMTILRGAGR